MTNQILVKCERCGTIFLRYNYGKGKKRVFKPHRRKHWRGHKHGRPSIKDPCYWCNGTVETANLNKHSG